MMCDECKEQEWEISISITDKDGILLDRVCLCKDCVKYFDHTFFSIGEIK